MLIGTAWILLAWSVADIADRGTGLPTRWQAISVLAHAQGTPGLAWVAVAIVLVVVGTLTVGGLSIEAARRRTQLVGQLRFAVTQQDLRSVVLLRHSWLPKYPGTGAGSRSRRSWPGSGLHLRP
ncbi:MAG: hypothetical protein R2789_12745 [Microthrixaceae bacterium]